jgi:hypothetical protein
MQGAFEWSGCVLGLLGALLLATHTRVSRYGWLAFLAANLTMIVFAAKAHHTGLLVQQTGFMATSLLGLRRAGLWPGRGTELTRNLGAQSGARQNRTRVEWEHQ